jgi:hypothetical protein
VTYQEPPEGWFTFGTHVDDPRPLEFSEEVGEDLLPLWERPRRRYAYEDPVVLEWVAALLRTGRRRALERQARSRMPRADLAQLLPPRHPALDARWVVLGCDTGEPTVEAHGDDPWVLADRLAAAAQQEEDRWPHLGLVYALVEVER